MERHGIAIDRGTAVHTRQLTTGNGGRGGRSDEDGGGWKKKKKKEKKPLHHWCEQDRSEASMHEQLRTVKPCERLAEKVEKQPSSVTQTKPEGDVAGEMKKL